MAVEMRSQRGAIGTSWLAAQVRERIEQALGPRARAKGKQAARRGAVHWMDVQFGRVEASVTAEPTEPGAASLGQVNSQPTGCGSAAAKTTGMGAAHPSLTIGPWHRGDAEALGTIMRSDPSTLMALLDGTYGPELEARLERESLGLLPGSNAYVSFDCSCTSLDVCPHVYALAYCFVERIDEAPADYLRTLGLDVEQLNAGADGGSNEDSAGVGLEESPSAPTMESETPGGGELGSSRFDPLALDPTLLHAMMSDDAASVLTAFYASAPPPHIDPSFSAPDRKDSSHD